MCIIVKRERLGRLCVVLMHWSFFCKDIIFRFWLCTQTKASLLFFCSFKCFCSSQKQIHNFKEFSMLGNIYFKIGLLSTSGIDLYRQKGWKSSIGFTCTLCFVQTSTINPSFFCASKLYNIHSHKFTCCLNSSFLVKVLSFGLWKQRTDLHKPSGFEGIKCFDKKIAVKRNSVAPLVMVLNFCSFLVFLECPLKRMYYATNIAHR